MDITLQREEIVETLKLVKDLTPQRSGAPGLLLRAEDGGLTVRATDLEKYLRTRLPGRIEAEGEVALDPGPLLSALRSTEATDVRLALDEEDQLIVRADGAEWSLVTADTDAHPAAPDLPEEVVLRVARERLEELVATTRFAVAAEKGRYALNGHLVVAGHELDDGDLGVRFAGADGAVLALSHAAGEGVEMPFMDAGEDEEAIEGRDWIVPTEPLDLALDLADEGEVVEWRIEDGHLLLACSGGHVLASLVEGQYPNVEEVLPATEDADTVMRAATEDLTRAVRQAEVTATDTSQAVTVTVGEQDAEKVLFASESPEVGHAEVEIEGAHEGPEVTFAANPTYLSNAIAALPGEEVAVHVQDARSPVLLVDPEHAERARVVVSPIVRDEE